DRSVSNQASLLYSRDIAADVKERIDYNGSAEELLKRISITSRQGQDFVNITAQARSPREAADIANAYAKQFADLVSDASSTRVKKALELSKQQLAAVPKGPAAAGARDEFRQQISRLQLALEVPPDVTRQVDPALPPNFPASPRPKRNALFAFIISLVA